MAHNHDSNAEHNEGALVPYNYHLNNNHDNLQEQKEYLNYNLGGSVGHYDAKTKVKDDITLGTYCNRTLGEDSSSGPGYNNWRGRAPEPV
eukprot:CAMPEP_0172326230 /NCGR_PEP_ID=MMETSP1058-20130122/55962_1 /TAXON_ID=83371 /ORGANISM="Detonula confervacea, Strain CCMP 353" /LENGTH=89 /DNA_ID=CAMNT_0013042965 /DNA_START=24 /DNA_END=290 /DNA_ORIENTATION=+